MLMGEGYDMEFVVNGVAYNQTTCLPTASTGSGCALYGVYMHLMTKNNVTLLKSKRVLGKMWKDASMCCRHNWP